ncbi:hypothetical protein BGX33_008148 [Mortierella sp. NVP41]|nr:hypothetical protein BGX33_008148 [Mortierella sp. NVP41]
MPPPASVTFFHLPELASLLASFLDARDLSRLMQTSQGLHALFHQLFWYHLELVSEDQVIQLVKSTKGLSAFTKNIDRIRSLKTTFVFLCYHYVAALDYMENNKDNSELPSESVLPVAAKPKWLPSPSYGPHMNAKPLPLLTHLTRLDINLEAMNGGRHLSFAVNMYNSSPLVFTVCWLLGLNPSLTHVRLHGLEIHTPPTVRVLARTLSKLHSLKHLELKCTSSCRPPIHNVTVVFLSLPQSIVSLKWKGDLAHLLETNFTALPEDADYHERPLALRSEPLQNLTVLELPSDTTGYVPDKLGFLLGHCPAIESLEFPFINPTDTDCDAMAKTIKASCTRIRHISVSQQYRDGQGHCLFDTAAALPQRQLETLHFTGIQDEQPSRMTLTLTNHSASLRKIIFREAIRLQSSTIQEILTNCRALEHFEVSGIRHSRLAISLDDVIETAWVCSNLRYLGLSVDLGDYSKPQTGVHEEQMRWNALEKFYRQLGKLTRLEVLDLKSVAVRVNPVGNVSDIAFESRVFPGLLVLEDKATDRRGYLGMLEGLKQLRELRGSVRVDVVDQDPSAMMGEREAEWIVNNWKQLRLATFLQDNHDKTPRLDVPAHLQWLQKQVPELRLSRQFETRFNYSSFGSASASTHSSAFTAGSASTHSSVFTAGPASTPPSTFTAGPASTASSAFTAGPTFTPSPTFTPPL